MRNTKRATLASIGSLLASVCFAADNALQVEIRTEAIDDSGWSELIDIEPTITMPNGNESNDRVVRIEFDEEEGELMKEFRARLESPPEGYGGAILNAKPGFYRERERLGVLLYAFNVEAGNWKKMLRLRESNAKELEGNELFRFYARARAHAEHVIGNVEPGSAVDRAEVTAVFHFLAASRELSYRYDIVPDDLVRTGRSWLESAHRYNENVVDNAVGHASAAQVIRQIDFLEGSQFTRIWDRLVPLYATDMEKFCPLARSLQSEFLSLSRKEQAIINEQKPILPLVADGVGECLWRARLGIDYIDGFGDEDPESVIRNQLSILGDAESVSREAGWSKLTALVERKKVDLRRVLQQD